MICPIESGKGRKSSGDGGNFGDRGRELCSVKPEARPPRAQGWMELRGEVVTTYRVSRTEEVREKGAVGRGPS